MSMLCKAFLVQVHALVDTISGRTSARIDIEEIVSDGGRLRNRRRWRRGKAREIHQITFGGSTPKKLHGKPGFRPAARRSTSKNQMREEGYAAF